MKKTFFSFLFAIICGFSFGQSSSLDSLLNKMLKKSIPTINVQELKSKYAEVSLLDAREYKEFSVSHLKKARFVGYNDFTLERVKDIPKNQEIVVYCSIGVRSEGIGEKLKKAGYTNVKNLYGSIFEWVNQGNSVYDLQNKPTKKVHAFDKKWGVWLKKGEKVY